MANDSLRCNVLVSRRREERSPEPAPGDGALQEAVRRALARRRLPEPWEQRREERRPYPYPVRITPLDRRGAADRAGATTVVGRRLALRGFDFYSTRPLAFRRAAAEFAVCGGPDVSAVLDLRWCRFLGEGWWLNGGRFLGLWEPPVAETLAAAELRLLRAEDELRLAIES